MPYIRSGPSSIFTEIIKIFRTTGICSHMSIQVLQVNKILYKIVIEEYLLKYAMYFSRVLMIACDQLKSASVHRAA